MVKIINTVIFKITATMLWQFLVVFTLGLTGLFGFLVSTITSPETGTASMLIGLMIPVGILLKAQRKGLVRFRDSGPLIYSTKVSRPFCIALFWADVIIVWAVYLVFSHIK